MPPSYFHLSRAPRYSLGFALPLLLLYESLAALLPVEATRGLRNAADVMLKTAAYAMAGPWGPPAVGLVLVAGAVWFIASDMRRSRDTPGVSVLGLMMAESAVLAVLFGLVVGVVTARLLGAAELLTAFLRISEAGGGSAAVAGAAPGFTLDALPVSARVMLSLGAGLYEEIVFRVLLVGLLAVGARVLLGMGRVPAGVLAAVLGALIFSGFHYVGPFGDPFEVHSFAFRFVAGLAFSALYLLRGFGITAWTHALYDVLVLAL